MTRGERGSALIEAVVALAMVAMVMAAAFQAISGSLARARAVADRHAAVLLAQSQMASVGADIPARPGTVSGTSGDWRWTVRIAAAGGETSSAGALLSVSVAVVRADEPKSAFSLGSLRIANAD